MEKISWTDRVKNEGGISLSHDRGKEYRTDKRNRKANWIGHILREYCPLTHVIEGKIEERREMTGRRGKRLTQLVDGFNEKRGYWKLKEAALDRTVCRTRSGRGCGPVVRQTS
jgi:hypothetical protein